MEGSINVVINREIKGVTAHMIDWWWENMGSNERFRLWHPDNHLSFEWEVAPNGNGSEGAIHLVTERIGGIVRQSRIRRDNPKSAPIGTSYGHVFVGSTLGPDDTVVDQVVYDYEDIPGGVRLRTTFVLPATTSEHLIETLRRHAIDEMERLPEFLPELYFADQCFLRN